MKLKKRVLIPLIVAAVSIALLVITIVFSVVIFSVVSAPKNVSDIIGKPLSLEDVTDYCYTTEKLKVSDKLEKAYAKKVTVTVLSVNSEEKTAEVCVSAPNIGTILSSHLVYENALNEFDEDQLISLIEDIPEDSLVSTTVTCPISENEDGGKLVLTPQLYLAIFPEISSLYGEILTNAINEEAVAQ
ncbi:MAG: hypothetical protein E7530_03530 [Ruminococcaceae bacterium]|nr:hypothetical protein [Oscillospiraceae bacterium]